MLYTEAVAYDSKGFPHERMRYYKLVRGKLIWGKGVSPLPKGWSWTRRKR